MILKQLHLLHITGNITTVSHQHNVVFGGNLILFFYNISELNTLELTQTTEGFCVYLLLQVIYS